MSRHNTSLNVNFSIDFDHGPQPDLGDMLNAFAPVLAGLAAAFKGAFDDKADKPDNVHRFDERAA